MRQQLKYSAVVISIGLIAAGCSSSKKRDPFAGIGSPYYSKAGPLPKGGGRYHIGNPYEVAGRLVQAKGAAEL